MARIAVLSNTHAGANGVEYAAALRALGHDVLLIGPRFTELDGLRWYDGLLEMEWPPTKDEADAYVGKVLAASPTPDIVTEKHDVYDYSLDVDAAIEFWSYGDAPIWTEAKPGQHHAVVFGDTHTSHLQDQVAQVRNGHYDSVWVQFRRSDLEAFDHPSKHWLPAAANPEVWKPIESVEKNIDVLFVGSTHAHVHKDRVALIRYLCDNGINVTVAHAFGSDAAALMARAKVVLNKSLAGDLNMRVAEALMAGAYLVTDYVDGLETFHGWHSYESQQEALSVIRYALDRREVERRMLGRATRMNAEAEHTYEHRARQMLRVLGLPEEGDARTEARPDGHVVSRDSGDVAGRPSVVVSGGGSDVPRDDVGRSVSIIIPAYNKWELTWPLLSHLANDPSVDGKAEVLVVDDGSTDETAKTHQTLSARIMHKESNSGFCSAVNYGVKHAKGEYIVVLNNDTTPEAGWLQPLIDELRLGIGIVGSLILNPDGTQQAAGVFQMPDGTWVNNAVLPEPPHPLMGDVIAMPVPSIQGACFAMRRDTYLRIGGLEEAWGNGGCCEVDLSLRVAKEGLPVRLRLDSKVRHAEGSTRFHVPGIGEKIAENQRRLIERWGGSDVRNGNADFGGGDMSDRGSSDRRVHHGAYGGIERRRTGTLASPARADGEKPLIVVWEGIYKMEEGGSLSGINTAVTRCLGEQGFVMGYAGRKDGVREWGENGVKKGVTGNPDMWVSHYWTPDGWEAPPERVPHWAAVAPWEYPPSITDLPDGWKRVAQNKRLEEIWTPSEYSRGLLIPTFGADRVKVIPNGVDLDVFNPEGEKAPGRDDLWRCLFVGGLIWRKGLDRLYEAWRLAFPPEEGAPAVLVLKSQGKSSFYQGQSIDPPVDLVRPQNVYPTISLIDRDMEATELASIYRKCDAVVLPFRFEGFCLPLLESMASGKPVVYPSHPPATEFVSESAGLAIPSVDHEIDVTSLARGLRWLFEHREDGVAMGAEGRKAAMAYGWPSVAKLYSDAIRRVCA